MFLKSIRNEKASSSLTGRYSFTIFIKRGGIFFSTILNIFYLPYSVNRFPWIARKDQVTNHWKKARQLIKDYIVAKTGPVQYTKEVKSEMKKVTWPSKDETIKSTIAVFVMVTIISLFLFFADQVMAFVIKLL